MDKPHASRASKILNMALEKKENAWGRYINRDNYLENKEHLLKETDEEEFCNEPENIGTLFKTVSDTLNNFQSDFNVDFNIQQSLLELPATCEQDDYEYKPVSPLVVGIEEETNNEISQLAQRSNIDHDEISVESDEKNITDSSDKKKSENYGKKTVK